MGLLGKIIKTGIAAGAAYAAVKIGEKYKEKNPEGNPEKTMDAFKEAANEFYKETSATVKEKAPGVIDTVKEEIVFTNIDKAALNEIETNISENMIRLKKEYPKDDKDD